MALPDLAAPPLEWARYYLAHRGAVIPVPAASKKPVLKEWQDLRLDDTSVSQHFNGEPQNLGLLLGAASEGLVDADLDCREAVILADRFLPATAVKFGRKSTGASHWIWRVVGPLATVKFQDAEKGPDGERAMLVELRSDGCQTIVPPSVHPSGERVTFLCHDFAPGEVDGGELLRRARLLALASLLCRHWPAEGGRHQAALGASGLLLRAGVPLEDVVTVVTAAAQVAGDTEARARRADVLSTHDRLADGAAVVGGPELAKALRGDGAAVVKQIRGWLGVHRLAEARWQPPADRPVIDTGNLGLAEMGAAAWQAIEQANEPPRVYRYGTALAWLGEDPAGRPRVEVMSQDHVRHHLAAVATFVRWTPGPRGGAPQKKPAFPPQALAADLLAVPGSTLPRLVRVVRVPVFTGGGRLLTTPGFEAASGIYFAPPAGLTLPAVADAPTKEEITAAVALLRELVRDFPFVADADHAHALAMLLTPFLRELIPGDVPMMVVSKPTPRTGAGLLVKVVGLVQEGAPPLPTTVSRDEEEIRKKLVAILIASPSMVLLDNLHGQLDSASLASILTCGGFFEDRLLGHTQTVVVPVRSLFVLTANNPALSGEMAGRSVLIRLDPKVEDPSTRSGFLHPQLEAWTLDQRGRLLGAVLTLGQAWLVAGRPRAAVTFGGFQEWAEILGGVLAVAGIPGFLANRRVLFEQADEENAQIRAFLADWRSQHAESAVLVKDLLDLAKNHALNLSGKTEQGLLVSLGRLVRALEDRQFTLDDITITVRRGRKSHSAVLWRLERGSLTSLGSLSPSMQVGAREKVEPTEIDSPNSPDSPEQDPEWIQEDLGGRL